MLLYFSLSSLVFNLSPLEYEDDSIPPNHPLRRGDWASLDDEIKEGEYARFLSMERRGEFVKGIDVVEDIDQDRTTSPATRLRSVRPMQGLEAEACAEMSASASETDSSIGGSKGSRHNAPWSGQKRPVPRSTKKGVDSDGILDPPSFELRRASFGSSVSSTAIPRGAAMDSALQRNDPTEAKRTKTAFGTCLIGEASSLFNDFAALQTELR